MVTATGHVRTPAAGSAVVLQPAPTACVVIGVHGGAGASTLIRLLDPLRNGEFVEWRPGMAPQFDRIPLLVARSTARGLAVAASFVARWRPDVLRPALVIVADAPFGTPPVVRYRQRALSSQVRGVIEVPYLYSLRHLDDAAQALENRQVATVVRRLRHQFNQLIAATSGGS